MRVLVQYSGGKDSQAALIWSVKKYGAKHIEAVFCDTKWEDPRTRIHIVETCEQLGVKLTILDSIGMEGLVAKKGRFPSAQARFCTEHLKVIPFCDYLLDTVRDHVLVVQGIRADESNARASMHEQCRYFKYYFEPYDRNDWKLQRKLTAMEKFTFAGKQVPEKLMADIDLLKQKVASGKMELKFHTYRKQDILAYCEQFCDDVIRPVFNETAHGVINMILDAGHQPNPKYKEGALRVGCDPCIFVGHVELFHTIQANPQRYRVDLPALEEKYGTYFFAPGTIPDRYCSKHIVNEDGEMRWYPTMLDVVNYLDMKNATGDLFNQTEEDGTRSCFSYYNICE